MLGARHPPPSARGHPRRPLRGSGCQHSPGSGAGCSLPRRGPTALTWEFWLVPVPASASRMICWAGASWAGSCLARASWGARGTRLTHSRPGRATPGPGCAGGGVSLSATDPLPWAWVPSLSSCRPWGQGWGQGPLSSHTAHLSAYRDGLRTRRGTASRASPKPRAGVNSET